mmetsp:Transcript_17099/g.58450  ORF Transcript_17099/g.58450 Transcript_17099/m.58450 type:complete len:442 (+) Transcript_17099:554-1879(+)
MGGGGDMAAGRGSVAPGGVLDALQRLPLPPGVVQVEYVWVVGSGDIRSKSRTVYLAAGCGRGAAAATQGDGDPTVVRAVAAPAPGRHAPALSPAEVPGWNFDGSSTGQATGDDSEVRLECVATFVDPFRGAPHVLALCECLLPRPVAAAAGDEELHGEGSETHRHHPAEPTLPSAPPPAPGCALGNHRGAARAVFGDPEVSRLEPWFGIEQEYTLFSAEHRWPLGWPPNGYPAPQGMYYCGAGADRAFGRQIADAHYRAMLYAGVKCSGTNAEVMPGQWEFQVGPLEGLDAGDHLTVARYLLHRVCELAGASASLHPKPVPGDWNGAGAHCNFSTKEMRAEGGYEKIMDAIEALKARHAEHIERYGDPSKNRLRLTGKHETCAIDVFSWGVANRGASIRVGRDVASERRGYLEDRRPSSDADPYLVTAALAHTTLRCENGQ